MTWFRHDVEYADFWLKDGRIYRTVGIYDDPTVEIQDMLSGKVEHHVIRCLNFSEYERLRPEARQDMVRARSSA